MTQMHNPALPGEILQEWLTEISVTEAASRLGISRVSLSRLRHGRCAPTLIGDNR